MDTETLRQILTTTNELEHFYQAECDEKNALIAEMEELNHQFEQAHASSKGGNAELRELTRFFRRMVTLNLGGRAEVVYRQMIEAIYASDDQPQEVENERDD